MINYLKTSFNIDTTYSINSVIYNLKKIPILGVFLPNDMYHMNGIKNIIKFFIIIFNIVKSFLMKLIYFYFIFLISSLFTDKSNAFIYTFIIFSSMSLVFNNKILRTSSKNYFSIILFGMDSNIYTKSNILFDINNDFICSFIILFLLKHNLVMSLVFAVIKVSFRYIGEYINLKFYLKNKYRITDRYSYFIYLLCCLLFFIMPYYNILFNINYLYLITIISFILFIISIKYIFNYKDYKLIYKRINNYKQSMTNDNLNTQSAIKINEKDKIINNKKLNNKHGYDLFNTIFFERHKNILLRSSFIYALIALGICFSILIFGYYKPEYNYYFRNFFDNNIGSFVFIMYFINRGMTVTRAMFYNCDHAMLTFNFYRDRNVIINLFKKRLLTLIKINLIPAFSIGLGVSLINYMCGGDIGTIFTIYLFIIVLSIFFSVHYLILYYLMQPFNIDMKINNFNYNIICFITYFASYQLINIKVSALSFSIFGILFTILYTIIALLLVYSISPKTFRIK